MTKHTVGRENMFFIVIWSVKTDMAMTAIVINAIAGIFSFICQFFIELEAIMLTC